MEFLGISIFDLAVFGVAGLAGLIGLLAGFIRGGLFLASWILAIVATLLAYPTVLPWVAEYFDKEWMAMLAAAGGTFLVSLLVLMLVSQLVARAVRSSHLNMLDRSLGLLAGVAVAIAVMSVIYLPIGANFPEGDYPNWIRDAKTRPIIEATSILLLHLIPEDLRSNLGDIATEARDDSSSLERLTAAPPVMPGGEATDAGYGDSVRDQLDREIENQQ